MLAVRESRSFMHMEIILCFHSKEIQNNYILPCLICFRVSLTCQKIDHIIDKLILMLLHFHTSNKFVLCQFDLMINFPQYTNFRLHTNIENHS